MAKRVVLGSGKASGDGPFPSLVSIVWVMCKLMRPPALSPNTCIHDNFLFVITTTH